MESKKEMEELVDIIKEVFGVDIREIGRKIDLVDGRLVFSKILRDRGYGIAVLGRHINKHHSSIIHYKDLANDLLHTNEAFASKYFICKDKFMCGRSNSIDIPTKETLNNEIDKLILEKSILLKKMHNNERLENIIKLIDSRTPNGKEDLVLRKINLMFNGMTYYENN